MKGVRPSTSLVESSGKFKKVREVKKVSAGSIKFEEVREESTRKFER